MQMIVKAKSIADAEKFALENRINTTTCSVVHETEVICWADDIYRNKAIVWFCKDTKAPFPMGTLLWHS